MKAVIAMHVESANNLETWDSARVEVDATLRNVKRAHLPNTPDVLVAGLFIESQIFAQAKPDVVTIQSVCMLVEMKEVLF